MVRKTRGSLTVVGSGICGPAQTTLEAVAFMRRCDRLYFLVADPLVGQWLRELNPTAESLEGFYAEGKDRTKTYDQIARTLVQATTSGLTVCAVFYGHPGCFVQASHLAIRRLRRLGYPAEMKPGISADACLYADLGINPGDIGMQHYEASDFLLRRRKVDPTAGLLLWQVGVLGRSISLAAPADPAKMALLVAKLKKSYPAGHAVVIYYAATFPGDPYSATAVPLSRLATTEIMPAALVYLKPAYQREDDPRMYKALVVAEAPGSPH